MTECLLLGRYPNYPRDTAVASPGNGLGLIQIQLDFFIWILMDLDLIGYGYPVALDSIGLDFVG